MPRLRFHGLVALRLLVAGALGSMAGCAHTTPSGQVVYAAPPPVQPWQREHLSKRAMRFDAEIEEDRFRQHWLGSREGADLGFGQPGGGCGCN
jgi:hypothetical protein